MTNYIDARFIQALCKIPEQRNLQDLQIIYYGLHGLESVSSYRDSVLRSLCKSVRYEHHQANHVLYYTGELCTCWYILLSGSVFIDGCMFLPTSSFGRKTAGSARRPNECFVLEASDMIVIDYMDNNKRSNFLSSRSEKICPGMPDRGRNLIIDQTASGSVVGSGSCYQSMGPPSGTTHPHRLYSAHSHFAAVARNRNSHSSDSSSVYSGSEHAEGDADADEVDLSGLVESIVDSDEDDVLSNNEGLVVRDTVRECLEKDPSERNEDDIDVLLHFTQHLKAFQPMTLSVRRACCSVMVFAVVEKAGTVVMNDGEELDSWSVLINGVVEIEDRNGKKTDISLGDSFGIRPTMEKLFHEGVMRTKCDDCQFVCITQTDYYRILNQGEENIKKHRDGEGRVVMVTEQRRYLEPGHKEAVVIRGTKEHLISQLIEENCMVDPTYVEDFLLTYRTFIDDPTFITDQLMNWFSSEELRDRITRVILLWVNNHFTDFETNPSLMDFLETFESQLERLNLTDHLRLLNIACAAKARHRVVILTRPKREEPLSFSLVGGQERACAIFVSEVDRNSKAHDVGLKRGDQIIEVNGQSFEHITLVRSLEILLGSTHLSITVKSNLTALKEVLKVPDNKPLSKGNRMKPLHTFLSGSSTNALKSHSYDLPDLQPNYRVNLNAIPHTPKLDGKSSTFFTLGPKKKFQKALMKILPKNLSVDTVDDSMVGKSSVRNSEASALSTHSHSQPDLISITFEESQSDFPDHVLKVYKSDQNFKYLPVHKETTAHEVVMLTLQEFGITEPSANFSLCEITVGEGGIVKQKQLSDQLQNLADRIGLSSRYYLKTNGTTETLVTEEAISEMMRESAVNFLQLNAVQVAIQLTLRDFQIFRQIESTEYIDDLFNIQSAYGKPALSQFSELVNQEMFWVVSEVCCESNLIKRSKIIKQFIKVARQCKECKNFNSMFAIVSGLGHGAVSRLRQTWDKIPSKYQKLFADMEDLMDPSRNMSKYRQLLSSEHANPPVIPFYPVVRKDLTFIDLGNQSIVDDLINFEKLRMLSKEIRTLINMCSSNYDLFSMLDQGGQIPSGTIVSVNQLNSAIANSIVIGASTVKRRKKASAAPNSKKMFEEAQMVRRVKAYLDKMKVETNEDRLHESSLCCEGSLSGSAPGSGQMRKRNPSPTLSTTSSTSSTSEGRKTTAPKFGSASPQAVKKLLSLSEQSKTRPHQPRHPSPSPGTHPRLLSRIPTSGPLPSPAPTPLPLPVHERSHSDSSPAPSFHAHFHRHNYQGHGLAHPQHHHHHHPPLVSSVDLNAESSSVTSLSNIYAPLRSITSSDSGHSTQMDSYSNSSVETPSAMYVTKPPSASSYTNALVHQRRRHSLMQLPADGIGVDDRVPASHSQYYGRGSVHGHTPDICYDDDDDDDETQVSTV